MLPKWIDEYYKCLTLPQRREKRAAIAISTIEIDKGAGYAVTPRRPHMRPLKIGHPTRELESTKANGWNGDVSVTPPTTPQTPLHRRPPKLGRPKAELEIMKPTKDEDESRSATPDGPGHARSPKPGQIKADIASNEARDQGATPEGPRRRPPKHGSPRAGTVNRASELNSAKVETSTLTVELKSAETETSSTTPRFDNARPEPNILAPEPKKDHAKTNTKISGPEIAQSEASIIIPKPDSAKAWTGPAAPKPKSAKEETAGTAPNLSKTPESEIEEAGGAIPGQPRPRPRKLGRPKAEAESPGRKAKIEISAATPKSDSVTEETSATAPNLGKSPEIEIGGAGYSKPEARRPVQRPPKFGRPKAEQGSQMSEKLAKKDEEPMPEKPYAEHPKLGNIKIDSESQETKPQQAVKKRDRKSRDATPEGVSPKAEGKSNHEKDTTPPTAWKRPVKIEKLKAELELAKSNEVTKKEDGARKSTHVKPAKAEAESTEVKSEKAPKKTDKEVGGTAPLNRPHPKSPAPEIDGRDERDENRTLPVARARPPKLGRPKARQERAQAERGYTAATKLATKEET